jgi:hypothetical protein
MIVLSSLSGGGEGRGLGSVSFGISLDFSGCENLLTIESVVRTPARLGWGVCLFFAK